MSKITDIIEVFRSKRLSNLLVPGFVDEFGAVKRFHPMLENVYFEFDDQLLRCSSIDQYWNLQLELVKEISCEFEIDEDDEFCISSISELVLKYPYGQNYVIGLRVFLSEESRLDEGIVKCAGFEIQCPESERTGDDSIFLDPQNPFGIQIDKKDLELEWRRMNVGSGYQERFWEIKR